MSERPQAEPRHAYPFFTRITTRWIDNDQYGHINNAVYYSFFDTAVNSYLIDRGALDMQAGEVIGLVVETHCNFFAPLQYPHTVEAGVRVAHVGSSSVRYEIGLFADAAATQRGVGALRSRVRRARQSPAGCVAPAVAGGARAVADGPSMSSAPDVAAVDAAITTRRSVRAFLDTPVPLETVRDILRVAARAPSGTNTQPWRVTVLTGRARAELSRRVGEAYDDPAQRDAHTQEYAYYPTQWVSPYIERRRKVGWDLYGLLGIGKTDHQRMHRQHARNYKFFDAPVGLIFTIERVLEKGSWLDYGMFLQNIMVAARARGLDTCPQAAWAPFHRLIEDFLHLPAGEMVVCGMSMGVADPQAIENTLVTEREPVEQFARFLD